MKKARNLRRIIPFLVAIFAPVPLRAQAPTSDVTGVVRDTARSPLGGVEVQAVDPATGFTYRALSSASGRYWLRGLPPGTYDVTARRVGLRAATVRNVKLAVGRTITIPFALRSTPVQLDPMVVGVRRPRIETTRPEVSYVLDRGRIEQVPQESRNFIELARMVPGATEGTESTGAFPGFNARGSSVGALNRQSLGVLVDGGDFTEGLFGDLSGSLPLLAVQEFEVVESPYSAEFGRAASGVVNVVTRRGGNEVRMEGFGLYRNQALDARGAFEKEKPNFSLFHWGGAVSGPIVRDRTHYFVAFERRVQDDASTVNTDGAFPAFEGTFKTPFTDNLIFLRLDHQAGDGHDLTLRYAGEMGRQLGDVGGINALEYGHRKSLDMHSGLLSHRWALSDNWLNEARLHVISTRTSQLRNAAPGPTLLYPSLRAGPNEGEVRSSTVRVELRDKLSWITAGGTGTHRLRFGTQLSWLHTRTRSSFFENGAFRFLHDADTLPARGQISFRDPALRLDARNLQVAAYVQDDWNPISRLTVKMGLRYDIESNGSDQGFISPFAGELPFIPTARRAIDNNNLAPRIGLAWDPEGDGRTVVRGGFGIFYDALVAGPLLALERSSGVPVAVIRNPPTTNISELGIDSTRVPLTVWTAGRIQTPMTRQYSLGVERVLPGNVVVRMDGMVVQGRDLLLSRNLNPIQGGSPRFPGYSQIIQILSSGRADAKLLLLDVREAFSRGWWEVGYTLGDRKNTNDTWGMPHVPQTNPDSLDLQREWGPAAWDERHRLVVTGGIRLPLGLGASVKAIYSSARPFTALVSGDPNGDLDFANDRPPGESRNARRGPDFFRTDLGVTWTRLNLGPMRLGLVVNAYNLFNTTNGVPSSVQRVVDNPDLPPVGRPLAAFAPRQVEVGMQMRRRAH